MRRYTAGLYILIVATFLSSVVNAQVWLEDRANREGPGFKLGDSLVLHLGLGLEGGYDTNALYAHDPTGAARLRITPYVDLATRSGKRMERNQATDQPTPPKATFRFGFAAFYDRYFSKDRHAVDQFNSNFNPFGFDTHLDFSVFPERKITLLGGLVYVKTMEPYETNADAQSKHQISPAFGMRIVPGGGTLVVEPKYRFNFLYFVDDAIARNSNKFSHDVSVVTTWKVFPKTALVSSILFSPTVYYETGTDNVNSYPLRSFLGIQGLLTKRFGIRVMAGYGASFYLSGPNFSSVIADAEAMFYITPFAKISVGGKRDFVDSFYGNYYERNGGYVSYSQMFAGRFLVTLKGDIYHRRYATYLGSTSDSGDVTIVPSTTQRKDVWVNTSLLFEYRATDWLSFHASGRIWADITDFYYESTVTDSDGNSQSANLYGDFFKFEVFGGIRVHY